MNLLFLIKEVIATNFPCIVFCLQPFWFASNFSCNRFDFNSFCLEPFWFQLILLAIVLIATNLGCNRFDFNSFCLQSFWLQLILIAIVLIATDLLAIVLIATDFACNCFFSLIFDAWPWYPMWALYYFRINAWSQLNKRYFCLQSMTSKGDRWDKKLICDLHKM